MSRSFIPLLKTRLTTTLLVTLTLLATGCASGPALDFVEPVLVGHDAPAPPTDGPDWLDNLGGKLGRPTAPLRDLEVAYAEASADDRPALRDAYIYRAFTLIDEYHEHYKIHLQGAIAAENTLFDLALLGLSAAGSVTTGEAAGALAAASSAVKGAHLSLDRHFFHERTITAIVAQMDAARLAQRAVIQRRMAGDADDYPLAAARADLLGYFYAGSLINATPAR